MRESVATHVIVSSLMLQFTPSRLRPVWMSIWREVSSTRKTPAKPSPKGTTAELKMLFERAIWSRLMIGLRLERHRTEDESAGRFSQGMFGRALAGAASDRAESAAGRACSLTESIGALSFMRAVRHLEPPQAGSRPTTCYQRCGRESSNYGPLLAWFVVRFTKRPVCAPGTVDSVVENCRIQGSPT